jgi:hypothetical protein
MAPTPSCHLSNRRSLGTPGLMLLSNLYPGSHGCHSLLPPVQPPAHQEPLHPELLKHERVARPVPLHNFYRQTNDFVQQLWIIKKKSDRKKMADKLTIYAPMIYTAPCIMFKMCAYPLWGPVGEGWAPELNSFFSFLGPVKWHQAGRWVPFGA